MTEQEIQTINKKTINENLQQILDIIYDLWEDIDNRIDEKHDKQIINVIKKIIKIRRLLNNHNSGVVMNFVANPKDDIQLQNYL